MDVARDAGTEPRGHAPRPWELVAANRSWTAAGVCLVAALSFLRFGFSGEALVGAFFAGVLVVLTVIDVERRIVPNRIVLPATAVVFLAQLALHEDRRVEFLLATIGSGLFLLLPLLVYPAGMGRGDVKLAMLLGAGLGASVLIAFVVGFMAAFFVAIGILVSRGSEGRKIAIPFVPFLAAGAIIALYFG